MEIGSQSLGCSAVAHLARKSFVNIAMPTVILLLIAGCSVNDPTNPSNGNSDGSTGSTTWVDLDNKIADFDLSLSSPETQQFTITQSHHMTVCFVTYYSAQAAIITSDQVTALTNKPTFSGYARFTGTLMNVANVRPQARCSGNHSAFRIAAPSTIPNRAIQEASMCGSWMHHSYRRFRLSGHLPTTPRTAANKSPIRPTGELVFHRAITILPDSTQVPYQSILLAMERCGSRTKPNSDLRRT